MSANLLQRIPVLMAAVLALALGLVSSGGFGEPRGPENTTVIRIALTPGVIEADVNPDDALVAAKVWSATLGASTGIFATSDARFFYDLSRLVSSVNAGEMDIVSLSTQEYLQVEGVLRAEPALTYYQSGQIELEYLMLARADSGFQAPSDLRGTRIAIAKGGRSSMTPLWLDALLYESGLPPKESFFKEIKEVAKTSQVVLPVFFRQIDAGVVTKSAFETAVSLNPQIGQQLKAIAVSARLVPMVTCLRTSIPAEQKALYVNQALKLHETPGGLQTFNVFRLDKMVPWQPRYFDAVRELMKEQKLARSLRQGPIRAGLAPSEERPR